MAIEVDWFGLSEGVATDARGSLTLVGFSPDFLIMPTLPAAMNLFLILRVTDNEDPELIFNEKTEVTIDAQIYGPDGKVLGGMQQSSFIGPKRHPDLPATATITLGFRLTFQKYGEHHAVIEMSVGDAHIRAERRFSVVQE